MNHFKHLYRLNKVLKFSTTRVKSNERG